jgi:hypothetical protein
MARQRLKLPEQNVRDYANELAIALARRQLAAIKDIHKQCRHSGAEYLDSEKAVLISYLNRPYKISYPEGEITPPTGGEEVPEKDKILMLDYFTRAGGTPLTGKLVTYKELHDGINYFGVFHKRAIQPLVNFFGKSPGKLVKTAEIFGGTPADYGDAAVKINAFSRVPVTLALWRGDEEFGPEGSILFDSTVADYLTNDDIHALCEGIAWKLVRQLQTRR